MIDWAHPVTLVEGPLDLLESGKNSACLLGSHLGYESQIFKKIIENKTEVFIALDADAHDKSDKIAKILTSFGTLVKQVHLPLNKDASDLGEKRFLDLKARASTWSKEGSLLRMIASMKSGSIF